MYSIEYLEEEHKQLNNLVDELQKKSFLSEDDRINIKRLKKRKLLIKDLLTAKQ